MPRFDSTINPTHILTVLTLLAAVATSYSALDKRLAVVEDNRPAQAAIDKRQDEELSDMKRNTREDLKEINTKLDKLLLAAQAGSFRQR